MKWWPLLIAVGIYLVLTLVNPFSDRHQRYNLEPYPDGLFYVVPAMRLASGQSFSMTYNETTAVYPKVVPWYSLVLSLGYLIWSQPTMFYWVNLVLGIVTLLGLHRTLQNLKLPPWAIVGGLLIYVAHALVLWLPSVPMAENLGLALLAWALAGLTVADHQRTTLVVSLTALAIGSLVLTKYTFITTAVVMSGYLGWELVSHKQWRLGLLALAWSLVLALVFVVYQISIGFNPFGIVTTFGQESTTIAGTTFYSATFVWPNLLRYAKVLMGIPDYFLWQVAPFTNGLVVLLAVWGIFNSVLKQTKFQRFSWLLLALLLSQFVILLLFYAVDTRYIVLCWPLLAICCAIGLSQLRRGWLRLVTLGLVLAVMAVHQRSLVKQLIAANWLGRSVGWQYEAVKASDSALGFQDQSYLITTLPPFLFELYSTGAYQLLPLSPDQEFLEKKEYVWGAEYDYANLIPMYHQLLAQGKKVYVTNSYLTAEPRFTQDFEQIKATFELTPIHHGCLETCNIYQLSAKN